MDGEGDLDSARPASDYDDPALMYVQPSCSRQWHGTTLLVTVSEDVGGPVLCTYCNSASI